MIESYQKFKVNLTILVKMIIKGVCVICSPITRHYLTEELLTCPNWARWTCLLDKVRDKWTGRRRVWSPGTEQQTQSVGGTRRTAGHRTWQRMFTLESWAGRLEANQWPIFAHFSRTSPLGRYLHVQGKCQETKFCLNVGHITLIFFPPKSLRDYCHAERFKPSQAKFILQYAPLKIISFTCLFDGLLNLPKEK